MVIHSLADIAINQTYYREYFHAVVEAAISAGVDCAQEIESGTQEAVFRALDERDPTVFDLHERETAGHYALEDGLALIGALGRAIETTSGEVVRAALEVLAPPSFDEARLFRRPQTEEVLVLAAAIC